MHAPTAYTANDVELEVAGQVYKQVQFFTYLGGGMTEPLDMFIETASQTCAYWICIGLYLRELYGHLKVVHFLKIRMVQAEAIKALLYGYSVRGHFTKNTTPKFASFTTGSCFASLRHSARDKTIG